MTGIGPTATRTLRYLAGHAPASGAAGPGRGEPRSAPRVGGIYVIDWKVPVTGGCVTPATLDASSSKPTERVDIPLNSSLGAGYASAATSSGRRLRSALVESFNQTGQPSALGFDAAVTC